MVSGRSSSSRKRLGWALLALAGLVALAAYLGTWPLIWRLVILPSVDWNKHKVRVEVYPNTLRQGRPDRLFESPDSFFLIGRPDTSLNAYAVWNVTEPGMYRVQFYCDDFGSLFLDGKLVVDFPETRPNLVRRQIFLGAGPHFVAVHLVNGPAKGRFGLARIHARGRYFTRLRGRDLAWPGHPDLRRWWDLSRRLEKAALIALTALLALALALSPPVRRAWPGWRRRPIRLAAVGLFLGFLLLPLAQTHYGLFSYDPLRENRYKARPPEGPLSRVLDPASGFTAQFERYFNDNYGLRDVFIRLRHQIDYSLFGLSDLILLGPEGWMFWKRSLDRQVDLERRPAEWFEERFRAFLRLNADLDARGVKLILVPVPQKETVYADLLPGQTARRPRPTFFDRYLAFLRGHPELALVDAPAILARLKRAGPCFHRTDTHWNYPAAMRVGRALFELIRESSDAGTAWGRDLPTVTNLFEGDQLQQLAVFNDLSEKATWPDEEARRPRQEAWQKKGAYQMPARLPYNFTFEGRPQATAGLLPRTVLWGDSFAQEFERGGLQWRFAAYYRSGFAHASLGELLDALPAGARFLVVQHLENSLAEVLEMLPR